VPLIAPRSTAPAPAPPTDSGSSDGTLRVWDCDAAAAITAAAVGKAESEQWQDGGDRDGEAACERVIAAHGDSVTALAEWEGGGLLASGSLDGRVRLWQLDDWEVRRRCEEGRAGLGWGWTGRTE
jgi:WD40 repeat protein